jgi:excisionase family DNA binding protein
MRSPPFSSVADSNSSARRKTHNPQFFTIGQVAEHLTVSTKTVRRWIEKKLLIAHRINGVVRISAADLAVFLATHRGF